MNCFLCGCDDPGSICYNRDKELWICLSCDDHILWQVYGGDESLRREGDGYKEINN